MKDYIAILGDIPAQHTGLIVEQINRAATNAVVLMRATGVSLPGETKMPTVAEVRKHLVAMANRALETYFSTQSQAPKSTQADEIWGEEGDDLFSVTVTGLSEDVQNGFTAEIDLNLLYEGQ